MSPFPPSQGTAATATAQGYQDRAFLNPVQNQKLQQGDIQYAVPDLQGGAGSISVSQYKVVNPGLLAGQPTGVRIQLDYWGDLKDAHWIQTVSTNDPQVQGLNDFVDTTPKQWPFYGGYTSTPATNSNGSYTFADQSVRPTTHAGDDWTAQVSLVGKDASGHYVNAITFQWGYSISNGATHMKPLTIVDPNQFQSAVTAHAK